jgi:ABC-2 type transport system ATP-binding protein
MHSSSVLSLNKVTKTFGSLNAVDDVSLKINKGEIYGFLGPNGAGKTTTIRMILDFIRPTTGTVTLFGNNNENGFIELLRGVGYLSADSTLYPNWTAKQHIDFVEKIRGQSPNALKLARKFDLKIHTRYKHLSSGNKQKLALVLALMHEPKLLVLDEPTRGLDPLLQQELYDILTDFKKRGGSVFMSSHNLGEVQKVCDSVGIIREGKLVASETMDTLRKLNTHEISVQFTAVINPDEFKSSNVELKHSTNKRIIALVRGDLNVFLSKVTKHKVADIEITHVSLEEMFMRYYQ